MENNVRGIPGPQGSLGSALSYADYYALVLSDNAATIAPGSDVSFSQDGPCRNLVLTIRNPSGNSTSLTLTPVAGGIRPVSAHLTIIQLN